MGTGPILPLVGTIKGEKSIFEKDEDREHWTKEDHIRRIQYLISSPKLYEPINMDCECSGPHIYPIPVIIDGWHRLFTHWHLGLSTISINFCGLIDLLEYLKGDTNIKLE